MTIYLKIIDGELMEAPCEFYDENNTYYIAFNQNIDAMIANGYGAYNEEDYARYLSGKKILKDGAFIENQTNEYMTNTRLAQIEVEILRAKSDYENVMATPVEYKNGKMYKPNYATDKYIEMLSAEFALKQAGLTGSLFPKLINDSSKLSENSVNMTYDELMDLTIFLSHKAETAWKEKATTINALLVEKRQLLQ